MTKLRALLLVIFLAVTGVSSAQAQDTLSAAGKLVREYESQKKNPVLAGVFEYAFPFAGYAYAGNWRGGLWPAALYMGGFALATPCLFADLEPCSEGAQQTAIAGLVLILASRVWGITGAAHTANDYNRALRQRLQIEPARSPDGLALRIGVRLPM
jgi:hypothetical protein